MLKEAELIGNDRLPRTVLAALPFLVVAVATVIGTLALPAAVAQAAAICNAPYDPGLPNPDDFRDAQGRPNKIDNPYFPLKPGTTFVYRGTSKAGGIEQDEVQVTSQTKPIQGVMTTVVRDEVKVDGVTTELTFDWFAQDDAGNVWYFGEDSTEFPSGSKAGSWEAGQNGARRGIIMEADPKVGDTYRQEFAAGVAEDIAEVRSRDSDVSVPYGRFGNALNTRDGSCIEAGFENKYYAPGVGLVLTVGKGKERSELSSVR
jgi:hypothetical protein